MTRSSIIGIRRAVCALLLLYGAGVRAEVPIEFRLKAAFLLNFAKLVQWPDSRFRGVSDPLRVCVLGADPFGKALDDTLAGKRAGDRALAVKRGVKAQDLLDCHLVYLGVGERPRYAQQMPLLAGAGILLVDEGESFSFPDGMIRFYLDQQRVRFELNPAAVEQARLKMDAKLVQIAKTVSP